MRRRIGRVITAVAVTAVAIVAWGATSDEAADSTRQAAGVRTPVHPNRLRSPDQRLRGPNEQSSLPNTARSVGEDSRPRQVNTGRGAITVSLGNSNSRATKQEGDAANESRATEHSVPNRRSLPLAPPSRSQHKKKSTDFLGSGKSAMIVSTLGSLAIVLALFFLLVWFVRRSRPKAAGALPTEAIERLGQMPMDSRRQLQLIRFGNKLLLLAVSNTSTESLGEITDPDEVERLTALCARRRSGSISESFRQVLMQLGNERHSPGFLGSDVVEEDHRARQRPRRNRGATYEA